MPAPIKKRAMPPDVIEITGTLCRLEWSNQHRIRYTALVKIDGSVVYSYRRPGTAHNYRLTNDLAPQVLKRRAKVEFNAARRAQLAHPARLVPPTLS